MKRKRLTLLLVPHDHANIRETSIAHRTIWMAMVAFVCVVGALTFYTIGYYTKVAREKKLRQLRSEKVVLLERIEVIGRDVEILGERISALIEHGKKLRVLANLPEIGEDTRKVGIGGPLYDEEEEVLTLSPDAEFLVSDVQGDLDQLLREADLERSSLAEIEERLARDQDLRDHTPSIRPCEGYFSSGFGMRRDPFTGRLRMHKGLDISGRTGTPIYAPANGTVMATGYTRGMGRYVIIDHGYGYRTMHGHLSEATVRRGAKVRRGEKIAEMGNTGRSTAPHLHYEVRYDGQAVNPWHYIFVED